MMHAVDTIDDLDAEFLYYCEQIQSCYTRLPRILQVRVEAWTRVLAVQGGPDSWIVDRNLHAKLLLQCIQKAEFVSPFDKKPYSDILPKLPPDVVLQLTSSRVFKRRRTAAHEQRPLPHAPQRHSLPPAPVPTVHGQAKTVRHEQVHLGWVPVPPPPSWPGAGREQGVQAGPPDARRAAAGRDTASIRREGAAATVQDSMLEQLQSMAATLHTLQHAVSQLQAQAQAQAQGWVVQEGGARRQEGGGVARHVQPVPHRSHPYERADSRHAAHPEQASSRVHREGHAARAPVAAPVPEDAASVEESCTTAAGQVTLDGSTASASDSVSPRPPANPAWNVPITPLALPTGCGPLREALLAALGELPAHERG